MYEVTKFIYNLQVIYNKFISFQLLMNANGEEEVQILTGLGQTFLTLGDITQATQVSVESGWSGKQN